MVKLLRVLVGYRDDLNLQAKWWHRLLAVCGALGIVALFGILLVVFASETYYPPQDEIQPLISMRQITKLAPKEIVNTVPEFLESEGELGALENGRIQYVSEYQVGKVVCSSDLAANAEAVAPLLKEKLNEDWTADVVREIMAEDAKNLKPGEDKRYCIYNPDELPFMSSEILKYKLTMKGKTHHYGLSLLQAGGIALGSLLVVLNLYYRGLVYVVCGPRKKAAAAV